MTLDKKPRFTPHSTNAPSSFAPLTAAQHATCARHSILESTASPPPLPPFDMRPEISSH